MTLSIPVKPSTLVSIGNWLTPLLPNEPRILNPQAQAELTEKFLSPFLQQLEACLLAVRKQVDNELAKTSVSKFGKPYPLGHCLEIAEAVHAWLRMLSESELDAEAAIGLRALKNFQQAGGDFRLVWGDLRGQYFQNAFQLGTLYVDVANDTVTPTKPKVEILPFQEAQFAPVRDFVHFSQLARRYWQQQVYPNHVLPHLAPHCPLILVSDEGRVMLHDATQYMLALARRDGFSSSAAVLYGPAMPVGVFDFACKALRKLGHSLPANPEEGRRLALQQCRLQRDKRRHLEKGLPDKIVQEVTKVNLSLVAYGALAKQREIQLRGNGMNSIKIDNIEYDLNTLSAEAKAQLQSIQFVDQELARLQAQVAAMQTARNAYVMALKEALHARRVTEKY